MYIFQNEPIWNWLLLGYKPSNSNIHHWFDSLRVWRHTYVCNVDSFRFTLLLFFCVFIYISRSAAHAHSLLSRVCIAFGTIAFDKIIIKKSIFFFISAHWNCIETKQCSLKANTLISHVGPYCLEQCFLNLFFSRPTFS